MKELFILKHLVIFETNFLKSITIVDRKLILEELQLRKKKIKTTNECLGA